MSSCQLVEAFRWPKQFHKYILRDENGQESNGLIATQCSFEAMSHTVEPYSSLSPTLYPVLSLSCCSVALQKRKGVINELERTNIQLLIVSWCNTRFATSFALYFPDCFLRGWPTIICLHLTLFFESSKLNDPKSVFTIYTSSQFQHQYHSIDLFTNSRLSSCPKYVALDVATICKQHNNYNSNNNNTNYYQCYFAVNFVVWPLALSTNKKCFFEPFYFYAQLSPCPDNRSNRRVHRDENYNYNHLHLLFCFTDTCPP